MEGFYVYDAKFYNNGLSFSWQTPVNLDVLIAHDLWRKAYEAYRKAYKSIEWVEWKSAYENELPTYVIQQLHHELVISDDYKEWKRLEMVYINYKFDHHITGEKLSWYGFQTDLD